MSKLGWIVGGAVAAGAVFYLARRARAQEVAPPVIPEVQPTIIDSWLIPVGREHTPEEFAEYVHTNRAMFETIAQRCVGPSARFVGTEIIRGEPRVRVILAHTEVGSMDVAAIQECLDRAL